MHWYFFCLPVLTNITPPLGFSCQSLKRLFNPLKFWISIPIFRARPGGRQIYANHIPFESSFHKEFERNNLNFHMLHDVASFIQNAFKCTLQGSKWIMCDVHNQSQKRSKNESKMLVMLWNLLTFVNTLSITPKNVLCNDMTSR